MDKFPDELFEHFLVKSFVIMHLDICKTEPFYDNTSSPQQITRTSLSSVCATWRRISAGQRFKAALSNQLAALHLVRVRHQNQLSVDVKIDVFDVDRDVRGVTLLNGKIYVVCPLSNTILAFDSCTFTRLEDVQVEVEGGQEINAMDIAACNRYQCLYVSDSNNFCCVLRLRYDHELLSAGDSGREVAKWLDGLNGYLSVTSEGNVLLVDGRSSTLYVYGPDAQQVRAIRLPSDMRHPRHAVEAPSGNYVVCHGWQDDILNRVCEVTKEGQVIRSYPAGHPTKEKHDELNTPLHVSLDAQGRVFVADCFNYRVLVLDSMFCLRRIIQSKRDQVGGRPWSIWYSQDTLQLIVGIACGHVDVLRVDSFKRYVIA